MAPLTAQGVRGLADVFGKFLLRAAGPRNALHGGVILSFEPIELGSLIRAESLPAGFHLLDRRLQPVQGRPGFLALLASGAQPLGRSLPELLDLFGGLVEGLCQRARKLGRLLLKPRENSFQISARARALLDCGGNLLAEILPSRNDPIE